MVSTTVLPECSTTRVCYLDAPSTTCAHDRRYASFDDVGLTCFESIEQFALALGLALGTKPESQEMAKEVASNLSREQGEGCALWPRDKLHHPALSICGKTRLGLKPAALRGYRGGIDSRRHR